MFYCHVPKSINGKGFTIKYESIYKSVMTTVWIIPSRVVQCTAYTTALGGLGIPHLPIQVGPTVCGFISKEQ